MEGGERCEWDEQSEWSGRGGGERSKVEVGAADERVDGMGGGMREVSEVRTRRAQPNEQAERRGRVGREAWGRGGLGLRTRLRRITCFLERDGNEVQRGAVQVRGLGSGGMQ